LPISAVDAINPAFTHTKQQLLQPFRFGQWARLALVGLLAGETSSGGGCNTSNFKIPFSRHPHSPGHVVNTAFPTHLPHHAAWGVGLILFLGLATIGLVLLLLYIGSVMRFILFDSVIARACHIRAGWARRRFAGLQLFIWQLLLIAVSSVGSLVIIGIPLFCAWTFGWLTLPREHLVPLVLGGALFLMLLLAFLLTLGVVHVLTKDFVVPQMALENISAFDGWRRLWSWIKAEKTSYAAYIGMKIVLAIGAGVAVAVLVFIVLLILLVPVGAVLAVAVIGGVMAHLTWTVYTITLALFAGFFLVAAILFASSFISVPTIVFFPAYAIYFFAPRYAPLAALLRPLEPIATPPTPVPPPLPRF
jgi:hypothetical protein